MDIKSTFSEHNSTTLEWTVKGLKHVFESTMGEAKSRSMFSEHFGHDRWRAQFMANSGEASDQGSTSSDGGWIGLFINCTRTPAEEKEKASSGNWVRDGKYHLTCEIQGLDKAALCVPKTEYNHSFSDKSSSWGWYKFASRNSVYFHSSDTVKQDAFVITCTVTAAPVTLHPTRS
ncbi:hypothetical protein BD779DRAFT_591053 [Infundibulicybe gibba]|nr:hypothetical protein BD779DRAFT_591053 [Infundibulicybe gibba]